MSFSWNSAVLLAALSALTACSSPLLATDADPPAGFTAPTAVVLRFEDEGTITLAPGKLREIHVVTSPPRSYGVRFAIIGDAIDGWIESATVQTDQNGMAAIALHAPSQPTTFHLRAAIVLPSGEAGPSAEASVAVSAQGFGAVRVLPQYAGARPIEQWTASVVARTMCADLTATLPGEADGALVAHGPFAQPLVIPNAPVGPNLAVAVRAGHFAWGCADTSALVPDGTLDVKVTVVDKPIDLAATDLDLDLEFKPDTAGYGGMMSAAGALLGDAFLPSGTDEATQVLEAMSAAARPEDAADFAAARSTLGWDAIAATHFAGLGKSLRDHCSGWIKAGMPLQAPAITAHLAAQEGALGSADLTVRTIGNIDASAAGVPPTSPFSWTADPDDKLILGGIVLWQPSRFAGAIALSGAMAAQPDTHTMADALAQAADCPGLGAALVGFDACDTTCMAALCKKALDDRWSLGLSASSNAGQIGHLTITASGAAVIDDAAEPRGFKGVWLGTVTDAVVSVKVKGSFEGSTPLDAPSP